MSMRRGDGGGGGGGGVTYDLNQNTSWCCVCVSMRGGDGGGYI